MLMNISKIENNFQVLYTLYTQYTVYDTLKCPDPSFYPDFDYVKM